MPNLDLKLQELDVFDGFIRRHIGPGVEDEAAMLAELGMKDIEELLDKVVPESIRRPVAPFRSVLKRSFRVCRSMKSCWE